MSGTELSEADVQFIKELRAARDDESLSRRETLKLLGALGVGVAGGGAAAQSIGIVSADASTSDSDGNVGLPGDRVDVFADGVDATIGDLATVLLQQVEETTVSANTGSSYDVDLTSGTVFDLTLDADASFTFSGAGDETGTNSFTMVLTQDGTGGRTPSWPGAVVWDSGTAPTISSSAGATDVLTFFSPDAGTTWYGMVGGQAFA